MGPPNGTVMATNFHNTLYVTSEGAYVAKSGETVTVRVDGQTRIQVPLHHLNRHRLLRMGWRQP